MEIKEHPHTAYVRKWRENNRDRAREITKKAVKKWRQANKAKSHAYQYEYRTRPLVLPKVKARVILNDAIKLGKLEKQNCERCGGKADAHHPDYSKPLEVIWACPKHHGLLHRKHK